MLYLFITLMVNIFILMPRDMSTMTPYHNPCLDSVKMETMEFSNIEEIRRYRDEVLDSQELFYTRFDCMGNKMLYCIEYGAEENQWYEVNIKEPEYENEVKVSKATKKAVKSTLKELKINKSCSKRAAAVKIFTYLENNCSYDKTLKKQRAIDCLNGSATCNGYSSAFYLLCNEAGIKTTYEVGYLNGELHSWNTVVIDGVKYYVDVTNSKGIDIKVFPKLWEGYSCIKSCS